jgi:hypothetical protein
MTYFLSIFQPLKNLKGTMRLIVVFFILVVGISSCKKSDSEADNVDPREQYLGSYDIDYTSKTSVTPGFPEFSEDQGEGGVITFTKAEASNELNMTIEFPGFSKSTDVVKLSGTKFTINRTRNKMIFGNKEYDGEYMGSGLFEGKTLTVTAVTKLTPSGLIVQWTQSYKGMRQ